MDTVRHRHPTQRHPVVVRDLARHAGNAQLRVADLVTRFAGSMTFVYLHVVAFVLWMVLAEGSPWPTLTLVVSLEAIFLSTFVMIGQNRQAEFQRLKADHDFVAQELELHVNTALTRAIDRATADIHQAVVEAGPDPTGRARATVQDELFQLAVPDEPLS
ncbi:MAG: hypothetical protein JWR20_2813 [Marmoricola sp.]|nr:hypothetical protein [Marmoricola sp.]